MNTHFKTSCKHLILLALVIMPLFVACNGRSDNVSESVERFCGIVDQYVEQIRTADIEQIKTSDYDRQLTQDFLNDNTPLTKADKALLTESVTKLGHAIVDRVRQDMPGLSPQQIENGNQHVTQTLTKLIEESETLGQVARKFSNSSLM